MVSQLDLPKTDPRSSRTVSLRQLSFLFIILSIYVLRPTAMCTTKFCCVATVLHTGSHTVLLLSRFIAGAAGNTGVVYEVFLQCCLMVCVESDVSRTLATYSIIAENGAVYFSVTRVLRAVAPYFIAVLAVDRRHRIIAHKSNL